MPDLNVLYIEDNVADFDLLQHSLAQSVGQGVYTITHSLTIKDAIENLEVANDFNAILLDLNLPNGRGLANIQTLRNVNKDIPILIITDAKDDSLIGQALDQGAQDFISKENMNADRVRRILKFSVLRQKSGQKLFEKAHYDGLTGLLNRNAFEETAQIMMRRAKRRNLNEALMFIDLNGFKAINDTRGHEAGNQILVEVARRLKKALRSSDLVARYGGDEFIIYLDNNRSDEITEDLCRLVAKKIIATIEDPITVNGLDLNVSLSIGVAIFPEAGDTFEALLQNADSAMYRAKNHPEKKYWIIGKNNSDRPLDLSSPLPEHKLEDMTKKKAAARKTASEAQVILIIDDDPMDRAMYKGFIDESKNNFTILEADSIRAARKVLENHTPACIILDNVLPDTHGLDFLYDLHENNKNFKSAIIMAAGADDREAAVQSLKLGAHDYLVKGEITHKKIIYAIKNAIEKNKLSQHIKHYQAELERSNQELSDFSQTVAHDLKAPMRKIIMFCEMLSEDENSNLSTDAQRYITRMDVSATRMQSLIDNLLIYAGVMRSVEVKETVSLKGLADDITQDLDVWLAENDAVVTIGALPESTVFKTRMQQLFMNLITNSVKYRHPERSPRLKISHKLEDGMCHISFTDNGMGIAPQYLDKIFNPFDRLHAADDIEGTGLGLSICRKIMDKHNGSIDAASVEGDGAVFTIRLPLSG